MSRNEHLMRRWRNERKVNGLMMLQQVSDLDQQHFKYTVCCFRNDGSVYRLMSTLPSFLKQQTVHLKCCGSESVQLWQDPCRSRDAGWSGHREDWTRWMRYLHPSTSSSSRSSSLNVGGEHQTGNSATQTPQRFATSIQMPMECACIY